MAEARWYDLGAVEALKTSPLQQIAIGRNRIALSYRDGVFGAISGLCNHVGGPLGEGHLDGDYVVCPWHHWKFHACTGEGEPGFEGIVHWADAILVATPIRWGSASSFISRWSSG